MADTAHDNKPLKTGVVFGDAPAPLGALWQKLSELEDQVGELLMQHPMGTIASHGDQGWMLADGGNELQVVTGQISLGALVDENSRFDFDLDWVDVDEAQLLDQIAVLNTVLAQPELMQSAKPRERASKVDTLLAEIQQTDPSAKFVEIDTTDEKRVYVGPIVASVGGYSPVYVQHLGRSTYAVHEGVIPDQPGLGPVEVRYDAGAPQLAPMQRSGLER